MHSIYCSALGTTGGRIPEQGDWAKCFVRVMATMNSIWMLGLILCGASAARAESAWQNGRATHYGTDAWNIHDGACAYGWLDRRIGTGWDVAAVTDATPDAKQACGKCKEVRCRQASFADGYGQWLERSNVCYDSSQSLVSLAIDAVYAFNHRPRALSRKAIGPIDLSSLLSLSHKVVSSLQVVSIGRVPCAGYNHITCIFRSAGRHCDHVSSLSTSQPQCAAYIGLSALKIQ